MMSVEKPKNFKRSIGKLAKYLGGYKIAIAIVGFCAALGTIFSVISPKIMGRATTALAEGLQKKITGTGGLDFAYIGKILMFTLALYAVSAVFSFD